MVIIILPAEEESVETHGSKEGCLNGRVAKRVNLPGDTWAGIGTKIVLNKLQT
jgi:hypothetical protein